MQIEIQIRGPRACGKSRLAKELEEFLKDALESYGGGPATHSVVIKSGLVPDPRGLEQETSFFV